MNLVSVYSTLLAILAGRGYTDLYAGQYLAFNEHEQHPLPACYIEFNNVRPLRASKGCNSKEYSIKVHVCTRVMQSTSSFAAAPARSAALAKTLGLADTVEADLVAAGWKFEGVAEPPTVESTHVVKLNFNRSFE